MRTKSCSNVSKDYNCKTCDYVTSKTSSYKKHLLTAKHILLTDSNQKVAESCLEFKCIICEKVYKSRVGLWGHKKKCSQKGEKLENTMITLDVNALVIDLLKQNQELQTQLIELSKEKTMTNCHNNNTNNNHFNLQFFLNETCKDAISADQFVKDIQISFGDLENIGNQGYVQGFTDIILKQLKTMDISKRPIHCTDVKRETIYIKDADAWKKDNEDNTKLKNVIENVAHKSRTNIPGWQRGHPEVVVLDSNDYEMNHKILRHTWGDGDTEKLQDKVVKNLAKEVHVDK
jgi:hypothetical protein